MLDIACRSNHNADGTKQIEGKYFRDVSPFDWLPRSHELRDDTIQGGLIHPYAGHKNGLYGLFEYLFSFETRGTFLWSGTLLEPIGSLKANSAAHYKNMASRICYRWALTKLQLHLEKLGNCQRTSHDGLLSSSEAFKWAELKPDNEDPSQVT